MSAHLTVRIPKLSRMKIDWNQEIGAWLSIIPTIVNGMFLSTDEFRDRLQLRYGIGLDNLPQKYSKMCFKRGPHVLK